MNSGNHPRHEGKEAEGTGRVNEPQGASGDAGKGRVDGQNKNQAPEEGSREWMVANFGAEYTANLEEHLSKVFLSSGSDSGQGSAAGGASSANPTTQTWQTETGTFVTEHVEEGSKHVSVTSIPVPGPKPGSS